jgi:hypothetical protein
MQKPNYPLSDSTNNNDCKKKEKEKHQRWQMVEKVCFLEFGFIGVEFSWVLML